MFKHLAGRARRNRAHVTSRLVVLPENTLKLATHDEHVTWTRDKEVTISCLTFELTSNPVVVHGHRVCEKRSFVTEIRSMSTQRLILTSANSEEFS